MIFALPGIDLDVFKMKTGKRVADYKKCCEIASWVHIDEMRSLLELWWVGGGSV